MFSSCVEAMHEDEVPFQKTMRASGQIRLAGTCRIRVTLCRHTQRPGCSVNNTTVASSEQRYWRVVTPHIWHCTVANDSSSHAHGIVRSRQRPSAAFSNFVSYDHVNASKAD